MCFYVHAEYNKNLAVSSIGHNVTMQVGTLAKSRVRHLVVRGFVCFATLLLFLHEYHHVGSRKIARTNRDFANWARALKQVAEELAAAAREAPGTVVEALQPCLRASDPSEPAACVLVHLPPSCLNVQSLI